jgi:hypothetical protein
MAAASVPAEVTVWTTAQRAEVVGRLLDLMGGAVKPIGVGGPSSSPRNQLAQRMHCTPTDDLRQMLLDHPASFVLLASMEQVGPEELKLAAGQQSVILTLEPIAADMDELAVLRERAPGSGGVLNRVVLLPSFRQCPGWVVSADPRPVLGEPEIIAMDHAGAAAEASVYARLYDAWQVVLHLSDAPLTIDAAIVADDGEPPPSLRGLRRHVTAHARMPGGGVALVVVSAAAAPRARRLHVVGRGGDLLVRDDDYALTDPAGQLIDGHGSGQNTPGYVELMANQWRRLLDRGLRPDDTGAKSAAHAVACCLTCLLSARTGAPEDPAKVLKMHGFA